MVEAGCDHYWQLVTTFMAGEPLFRLTWDTRSSGDKVVLRGQTFHVIAHEIASARFLIMITAGQHHCHKSHRHASIFRSRLKKAPGFSTTPTSSIGIGVSPARTDQVRIRKEPNGTQNRPVRRSNLESPTTDPALHRPGEDLCILLVEK